MRTKLIKNLKRSANESVTKSNPIAAKKMRLPANNITPAVKKLSKRVTNIKKKVNSVGSKPIRSPSELDKILKRIEDSDNEDTEKENDDVLFDIENVNCEMKDYSDLEEKKTNSVPNSEDGKKKKARARKMCEICGKVVTSKLFRDHMNFHLDPAKVTCSFCDKVFSSVSTLRNHLIWTHTQARPFMCDLCGNTFKRNDHLKQHRDQFHSHDESMSRSALKCEICGSSLQTMATLQSHMKRIHGKTKVNSVLTAENHKILADSSYECGICNLNFKQFNYLRIHIKFVHEKGFPWHINQGAGGPYKCASCVKTYATLQSLREHNRRLHNGLPVEKFKKECQHCGFIYRNRIHFSKHMAKLSGRPTCYVCWSNFDSGDLLKEHINRDHVAELPFGCELCGVRFVYLTELRNHMHTHSQEKTFKCEVCTQRFGRKDFLKSHMRRHIGVKNHVCKDCNKSFVEVCDLIKHKLIHLKPKRVEDKNHVCEECNERFVEVCELVNHRLIHLKSDKIDDEVVTID